MKTFWSAVIVFLLIDAWFYHTGKESYIWGRRTEIVQFFEQAAHEAELREQQRKAQQ